MRAIKKISFIFFSVILLLNCTVDINKNEFRKMTSHNYKNFTFEQVFDAVSNAFNDNQLKIDQKSIKEGYIKASAVQNKGNFFTRLFVGDTSNYTIYTANIGELDGVTVRLNIQKDGVTVLDKKEYEELFKDISNNLKLTNVK